MIARMTCERSMDWADVVTLLSKIADMTRGIPEVADVHNAAVDTLSDACFELEREQDDVRRDGYYRDMHDVKSWCRGVQI